MKLAFINRKGGTAKSVSSLYTAMALYQAGEAVTLIDCDAEKSCIKYASAGLLPFEVVAGEKDLVLQAMSYNHHLIYDTPPNNPEIIFDVAEIADECIVPVQATAMDTGRLMSTLRVIAKVEKMRQLPLASVLIVRWKSRLKISQEVEQTLQEMNVPLLEQKIRDLTRYTTFETPSYLDEYRAVLNELEVLNNA